MAILRKEGERADSPTPDVVLLDLKLPRKDGFEVLTEIRADAQFSGLPVIILTSSQSEQDRLRSAGLETSSYVSKPLDTQRFDLIVSGLMGEEGSPTTSADAWFRLADLEGLEREGSMLVQYAELAAMPEEERVAQMLANAEALYDLPDDRLRDFTRSILRAWLKLEPEAAGIVGESYEQVIKKLPGNKAMRRVGFMQTMVKAADFTLEEQDQLTALAPSIFGGATRTDVSTVTREREEEAAAQAPEPKKKGWGPFGRG